MSLKLSKVKQMVKNKSQKLPNCQILQNLSNYVQQNTAISDYFMDENIG